MNPDHIAALVLITGAVTWVAAFVARELWSEWRIRASEKQWRAWFAALPESERRAGAERLWEAVSETPIHDGLAAQIFHSQLADDERIWDRVEREYRDEMNREYWEGER